MTDFIHTVFTLICIFIHIFVNFHIIRYLQRYVIFFKESMKKNKIFIYNIHKKLEECKQELFSVKFVFCILYFIFVIYTYEFKMFSFFFLSFLLESFCRTPEKNNVLKCNNLNIGYGAALCYYENYLKRNLPEKFKERIENFKTINKVALDNKLYILIPKSCKILQYLDDESGCIERCKELPKHEQSLAGIKSRVFNMTVYLIRKNVECAKGIRLAVEYAQPLKGLYIFKEKLKISEEEMFTERQLFVENLKKFLRDKYDSYKYCKLIEYDDDKRKVSDVLLESYNAN